MTNETERKTLEQPEETKNTAGKKGVKKRNGTKSVLFPILLTALLLGAFYTARIVYFCTQYPQKTVSIEALCGENGEGLDQLSYDGTKFYAESTRPTITLDLENGGPIRCIGFGVRNLSRENCWSYITIERARGSMERGSVIMAEGSNAIDFDDVTPQDEVTRIVFMPVPVRGVSFSLTSFTINPRSHIIGTELLNYLVLLSVAVMFEAVVLAMLRENRRVGFPHLWTVMLAAILQMFLGYLFISQYFTDAWTAYATFYHFAVFLSEGAFLLLLHLPSYSTVPRADHASAAGNGGGSILVTKDRFTGGRPLPRKHELVLLRTLLLSIFSFSLLELLYSDMFRLDDMESWWLNILVYAVPFLVLYAVWGRHKRHWSYGVGLIWWLFAAMVNHYYFQYRAQAIEFSDLSMAGTAKNVMNGPFRLCGVRPDADRDQHGGLPRASGEEVAEPPGGSCRGSRLCADCGGESPGGESLEYQYRDASPRLCPLFLLLHGEIAGETDTGRIFRSGGGADSGKIRGSRHAGRREIVRRCDQK